MLDLEPNFTSQNSLKDSKLPNVSSLDNHAVVFVSRWYKTEGDSLYIDYNVWGMEVKLDVSDSRQ